MPKTRLSYWRPKIAATRSRDDRVLHELTKWGWFGVTIWECDTRKAATLNKTIDRLLEAVPEVRFA